MITAGFPRQAAFVASIASACCDQMYGGSSATSSEVVAREAGVGRHVPELAARPHPHQGQPDVSEETARVGDHEVPVRSEDPHELRQRLPEVRHVAQCDRADDEIDGVVGERQIVQIRLVEGPAGHLLAGARQHLGRGVHADHLVAERRQVRGVAAGTAGSVESDPDREAVEDLAHDRLFDVEELIARLVVDRCPPVVAFACRDGARFDPVAQLLGRIQERLDLAEPGEGEVPVVHAAERLEQRHALQAEEIRQRVLVDHGSVDAANT